MLEKTGRNLVQDYDRLRVTAICSDFRRPSAALADALTPGIRNIVLFSARRSAISTSMKRSRCFATCAASSATATHLPRRRSPQAEVSPGPAYDDALGVTQRSTSIYCSGSTASWAATSISSNSPPRVLRRSAWPRGDASGQPRAANGAHRRLRGRFDAGETIHTETRTNNDDATLDRIARDSDSRRAKWTDAQGWFADVLLRMRG